jgi:hypothetical protein
MDLAEGDISRQVYLKVRPLVQLLAISSVADPGPTPDPSIIMQNGKKNLDSYYYVTIFDFLSLTNDANVLTFKKL